MIIGNVISPFRHSVSRYWTPQSLVVEDAAPTHVVMTGLNADTKAVAGDFTPSIGASVSLSRNGTNKILTLVINTSIVYGNALTITYKGKVYSVTNNVAWTGPILTNLNVVTSSDTVQDLTVDFTTSAEDGVSWEYSTDNITYTQKGTTTANVKTYHATGLTAGILYYWKARAYKGAINGAYSNVAIAATYSTPYTLLDTYDNSDWVMISAIAQNPVNPNIVVETFLEAAPYGSAYDDTKCIKRRKSTDKAQTFGAASTFYEPGANLCVQEQHSGYTSDGRFHVLATVIDASLACTLKYIYSDDNGDTTTITDITTLVADVTRPIFRNSGKLIENNGVLMGMLYRQSSPNTSSNRSILRLVSGTWTQVSIETTTAYENESSIISLGGDNLLLMVREDVTFGFVQHVSTDNGLTWTRLGITQLGTTSGQAWPAQLESFNMQGESVIAFYFPRYVTGNPLYAVYGRASDLITYGIAGWNIATLKTILTPVTPYLYTYHGRTFHFNNDYNAIGCWPVVKTDQSAAKILTFKVDTTDYVTLASKLFYTLGTSASDFNTAAGISDAGQQLAVTNLVRGLKGALIWTKIPAAYPMIGGTAASHKWNLINPVDSDAAFRLTFVNGAGTGWTHSANGALPDGTGSYANTHINPSTDLTLYSEGIGYYSRTNVSEAGIDMGSLHNDNPTNTYPCFMLRVRYTDGKGRFYNHNGYLANDTATTAVVADSRGFTSGSRTANNVNKIFINGVQSGITNTTTALSTRPNFVLYLGANNSDGTAASFVTKQCAFAIVKAGLTDDEEKFLYLTIQAFETALSRQV